MPLRVLFVCVCLVLAVSACKNEPYQYPPMGVTGLTNIVSGLTSTYRYRNQKIYSFQVGTSTETYATFKFTYAADQLVTIVRDSTATSKRISRFYRTGNVVTDTATLEQGTVSRTVGANAVTYDNDGNPVIINRKDWTEAPTEEQAELVWENGNVVRLTTYTITSGEKKLVKDLAITYDDKTGVYTRNTDYLYTLGSKDLFWLSTNNPVVFNDGTGEKKYQFWFNKMGYPSNYKNEIGTLFGVNYTQLR